jgi:hypothetical protein
LRLRKSLNLGINKLLVLVYLEIWDIQRKLRVYNIRKLIYGGDKICYYKHELIVVEAIKIKHEKIRISNIPARQTIGRRGNTKQIRMTKILMFQTT